VLADLFYSDKSTDRAHNCIKAAIWRLNDLFEPTDIAVRMPGGRWHGYRVVKRLVKEVE
jgi:hypothetical protein